MNVTLIGGAAHGRRAIPCACCAHTSHAIIGFGRGLVVVETYRGRVWELADGREVRLPLYAAAGGPRG